MLENGLLNHRNHSKNQTVLVVVSSLKLQSFKLASKLEIYNNKQLSNFIIEILL